VSPGDERDPGRGASAELPLYGVDDWPGGRQAGSPSGIGRSGRGGDYALVTSVGVDHRHGDASITVTSHRRQDQDLGSLRRWVSLNAVRAMVREHADRAGELVSSPEAERLLSAARLDELPWEDVTIPVEGQPTPFQLFEVQDGWWVAAGRGPNADLTLASRSVPLAGLALARVTDQPVPAPRRHLERPQTPARQFPADAGPAAVIPGHACVDLIFEGSRLLSGSVGGQPVRLDLNAPTHKGAAAGTIAGIPVSATWENQDNYYVYPDVSAGLTGSFAGQPAELHATFHLEPGYFFDYGMIIGRIGADDLKATVERVSGGLGSTSTVAVEGMLGSIAFTIYAAIDGPLTSGQIRGTVAGSPIRLDAARTRHPDGDMTRLTGSYQGPPALLALTAGALLHFI